ncbi:WYL domain-containing protein [Mesorhizobium sp. M8A.F.Ca.ET.207.01.1.1]|uniref:helix-turn-helix transcriptional regulator n=1 Tax=Mesorhizobium sp. M8A.F.Ca.ET.207.01.1.1 TaxID=2563968 RepID=UPI000FE76051|nr:WYL domain-containing protein [Mesorhizobium sp. M8A.F.Ca.ET.207.01.1.1]RWC29986.1 MAG: WYL domain-containing protein [Mesorhizobium sp.]TGQ80125.1 WYL domain-containing protein [Mesorhizobium sp. M8A.F.Ca.ET.207.01.1.1]
MSFAKAQDLLRLAQIAASRRGGICLEEICSEFGISHRTAQRMTEALDATFANVQTEDREDRRRYWRLDARPPERLQPRQETIIEALEIAARLARDQGRLRHARALEDMRDGLLARLTPRDARRSEADAEAVLASLGQVMRPGPTVALRPDVTDAVIEALRGPFRLRVIYGPADAEPRVIEPHGLLLGHRSYLVARQPARGETMLNFRMDRIHAAEVLDESFGFATGFGLNDYAAQAFGVYQDPEQYGEVIWRFAPVAAERAAEFRFHPTQVMEPQEDGGLIVRFYAAGWLEMAWHLYQWGDKVEVVAPDRLRALVDGHRRPDFDALP